MSREKAKESIAWANACAKTYYNVKHTPITLKERDLAFLKLHAGYSILSLPNKKLSQQRVGPFHILQKIGKLAYRLELPPVMKMNPVISIAQLEPLPASPDPYNRQRHKPVMPVVTDNQLTDNKYYVKRLLDKRIVQDKTQYLVKWLHYWPEHNVWYGLDDLADAIDKIKGFKKLPSATSQWARKRNCVQVVLPPPLA